MVLGGTTSEGGQGAEVGSEARYPVRGRHVRGQSLIELALVVPVLIVVLLGIAEFSRLWYAYITVDNAARVGAQYGAQSREAARDVAGIEAAVREEIATLFDVTPSNPSVYVLNGTDPYGYAFVSVTVTYFFHPLLPVPGIPSSLNLTKTSIMRVRP